MNLSKKLAEVEREVTSEKGAFALFGLFLREDSEDRWDLVVSAPWIESDKEASIEYLAEKVKSRLDAEDIIQLSRIASLDKNNPVLEAINNAARVKSGGEMNLQNCLFGNVTIAKAIIMVSDSSVWQQQPD